MTLEKNSRQSRVKEALGRIYDQHPPHFREYLRRYEQDPTSRVFAPLAEAYRRLGRLDEAIDICQEGLEHHPDFHGGRVALAKCYFDKKMFREARAELERVTQYVPENLMAQRLLGETFLAMGDRVAALHCLKMAQLLSPEDVALSEKIHTLERNPAHLPKPVKLDEALPEETIAESAPEEAVALPPENSVAPVEAADALFDGKDAESFVDPADDPLLKKDEEDEAFAIQHVSAIFVEPASGGKREITTATLANLYFSQGQFDRCLRILEKLDAKQTTPEIQKRINACRAKLGLSADDIVRTQKIELLRGILARVRSHST